jgi:hypothetical protein
MKKRISKENINFHCNCWNSFSSNDWKLKTYVHMFSKDEVYYRDICDECWEYIDVEKPVLLSAKKS